MPSDETPMQPAQNIVNAALSAACGVPKSVIDARKTHPKPKPPATLPEEPPNHIAGETADISTR